MNKCKCKLCGDVIESKDRHDFVRCKCGEIFTDGGDEYIHRGAMTDLRNIIDLSSEDNTYGCDICGGRFDWDKEIVWVTTSVGLCQACHDKNITDRLCPHCDNPLFVSDLPDYEYVCYECDENFYECETKGEK